MIELFNAFSEEFETQNQQFNQHKKKYIANAKDILQWAEPKMEELNNHLKKHNFESTEEEIHFFKVQKPQLMAWIIFYKEVLRIEVAKPATKALQKQYYLEIVEESNNYFKKEHKLFKYYRANENVLDKIYFTRNSKKDILETECFQLNIDPKVSTCYDYKLANIMARETLSVFLDNQIQYVQRKKNKKKFVSKWQWTGSKTDLTEMIYALQANKNINHGNVEIKELATEVGKMLNVDIQHNIYRTFINIKNRKNNKALFMNELSTSLHNKLTEEEMQ